MLGVIEQCVTLLGAYLAAGCLFAVVFVTIGAGRVSRAARGAGWALRLMLIPGAAMLWPLLAARWILGPDPATRGPLALHESPSDSEAETSV